MLVTGYSDSGSSSIKKSTIKRTQETRGRNNTVSDYSNVQFNHFTDLENRACRVALEYINALNGCISDTNEITFDKFICESWTGESELTNYESIVESSFVLDPITIRDLNLLPSNRLSHGGGTKNYSCLFEFINHCETQIGKKKLLNWMLNPLKHGRQIRRRQKAISWLLSNVDDTSNNKVDELDDLKCIWLKHVIQGLHKSRKIEKTISSLRSNLVCSPRSIIALLSFIKSIHPISTIGNELLRSDDDNLLPDLLFHTLPSDYIDDAIGKSAILGNQLDIDSIKRYGRCAFLASSEYKEGSLSSLEHKISDIKATLEGSLKDLNNKLGTNSLRFKSYASKCETIDVRTNYLVEVDNFEQWKIQGHIQGAI